MQIQEQRLVFVLIKRDLPGIFNVDPAGLLWGFQGQIFLHILQEKLLFILSKDIFVESFLNVI